MDTTAAFTVRRGELLFLCHVPMPFTAATIKLTMMMANTAKMKTCAKPNVVSKPKPNPIDVLLQRM